MKLYVSPGACCLGAEVVVHALELPVEIVSVPLRQPDSPIHQVNPLGRVPALRLRRGSLLRRFERANGWLRSEWAHALHKQNDQEGHT